LVFSFTVLILQQGHIIDAGCCGSCGNSPAGIGGCITGRLGCIMEPEEWLTYWQINIYIFHNFTLIEMNNMSVGSERQNQNYQAAQPNGKNNFKPRFCRMS